MKTEDSMFELMMQRNGEIRIMAGRYGGGWIAVGCSEMEWSLGYEWDNLNLGDTNYFSARHSLLTSEDVAFVEHCPTARSAFERCVARLCAIHVRRLYDVR